MKESRQIQLALLTSLLSVALSLVMLVGTTLAWFSQTVVNSGNTLTAGTIQAGFALADSGTNQPETLNGETQVLKTTSWEPGQKEDVIFQLEARQDSLNFTYSIWLKSDTPLAQLGQYLEVYQVTGEGESETQRLLGGVFQLINTPLVSLPAEQEDTSVHLRIQMVDTAPIALANETEPLDLAFVARAEQVRQPVSKGADLASQLEAAGLMQLGADVTIDRPDPSVQSLLTVEKGSMGTMLELSQYTLAAPLSEGQALLEVGEGTQLTLNGAAATDHTASGTLDAGNGIGIRVCGGTVMINGGTYTGAIPLQVESGIAIIRGGTFVNWDPSLWLAPGCRVEGKPDGEGNTLYTVSSQT